MATLTSVARALVWRTRGWRVRRELARLRSLARYKSTETFLITQGFEVPDGPSFAAAFQAIFLDEVYRFEPALDASRIIDCGANIGVATIYFARTYPGASITSFEPDPALFAVLERNCRRAGVGRNVELVNAAVWTHNGVVTFESEGADAGRVTDDEGHTVRAVRLADQLDTPADLVKVDIEGSEVAVLTDASGLLARARHLFVEWHSYVNQGQDLDEVLSLLSRCGFRYRLGSEWRSRAPFLEPRAQSGMDSQVNIFAYRP